VVQKTQLEMTIHDELTDDGVVIDLLRVTSRYASSSINAFAAIKSCVSNPSLNQS
jgi:hypothetical protein